MLVARPELFLFYLFEMIDWLVWLSGEGGKEANSQKLARVAKGQARRMLAMTAKESGEDAC